MSVMCYKPEMYSTHGGGGGTGEVCVKKEEGTTDSHFQRIVQKTVFSMKNHFTNVFILID